jgi:glycosyltransferase involved in cell wall biosynthesis
MKGISVILTAFNRRDYLNDPLDSLINQDFDKTMMEIILVKNFSDKMIDDKIAEYGGKLVYSDSNFGRMVADAIELATKDIIAFLDDDDFF